MKHPNHHHSSRNNLHGGVGPSSRGRSEQQQQRGKVGEKRESETTTTSNIRRTSTNTHGTANTVRVVAPATLQEGYQFDVMLHKNSKPYTVTVPKGGVHAGQEFEIPLVYPDGTYSHSSSGECDDDDDNVEEGVGDESVVSNLDDDGDQDDNKNLEKKVDEKLRQKGQWRRSLCSCWDVLTQATFWMGLICTPILMGQLLTRLGLDWQGRDCDDNEERALTFNRIVMAAIAVLLLGYIPVIGFIVILSYWLFVVVWIGTNVRNVMRRRYRIPASCMGGCCNGKLNDCVCMTMCGCCSTIQMARQTHNDHEHPGYCCTTTGLPPDAPPIV